MEKNDYMHLMMLSNFATRMAELARRADEEFQVVMRRHGLDPMVPHRFDNEACTLTPLSTPIATIPATGTSSQLEPGSVVRLSPQPPRRRRK